MTKHLAPLVTTQARRRMAVVAGTALLFGLFTAGTDIILPLWATREFGFTAGEWAHLRSLRFTGVLVGVIFLGALSDRFGQRLFGALSMIGTALTLVCMGIGSKSGITLCMPVFGAFISTAFVNLNTLTQQVSNARQGVANTIYRSIGAAAGIVAPLLVTVLAVAWHGYPMVLYASAAILVVAALVLFLYPGETIPPSLGSWQEETRRLLGGYWLALKQRQLMAYILVSLIWGNMLTGVGAFAAIRFTEQLHQSDQKFGALSAAAGVLTFLVTAGAGIFLDRVSLRKLHLVVALLASLCSVLMGVSDSLWPSIIGFVVFIPLTSMLAGPMSMWVSRVAGAGTQTAAFSVHKVLSAASVALAMALIGVIESRIGMRATFLYGGVLGLITGLGFLLLREPPRLGRLAGS